MSHLLTTDIDHSDPAFLYLNLHPDEEINLIIRHHWGGFLGTIFIVLGMALVPAFFLYVFFVTFPARAPEYLPMIIILFSGFYIFLATFLFGSWINFYYDIIFVTNERIINIDQEGLLARRTSELSLDQVQNVTAEVNGFLRSLLNFGAIVIETAGGGTADNPSLPGLQGYFTVNDIPDPNQVARIILELHRTNEVEDAGPNP